MLAGCLGITIRPVWSPDGKIDTQLNKLLCLHQSEAREMWPDWPVRVTHPAVCSGELGKPRSTHSTLWTLLAYLLRQRGASGPYQASKQRALRQDQEGFTRLITETSQMTHDSWLEKYWEGYYMAKILEDGDQQSRQDRSQGQRRGTPATLRQGRGAGGGR